MSELVPLESAAGPARRRRETIGDKRLRRTIGDKRLCRAIGDVVAEALGVTGRAMRASRRGTARAAFARQAAMYLGHVVFGLNLTRLGHGFGRDRTTVRHACRRVENLRDDPRIDRVLGVLETVCADLAAAAAPRGRP